MMPTHVSAQEASSAEEAIKSAGISVEVPVDGVPVKYTVDGEEFEVSPGASMQLPSGAANIVLPAGTVLSASKTTTSGTKSIAKFEVVNDITFPSFSAKDVRRTLKRFPRGIRGLESFWMTPNGELVRNPRMDYGVMELVRYAELVQVNAANVNAVLGKGGTDDNGRKGKNGSKN